MPPGEPCAMDAHDVAYYRHHGHLTVNHVFEPGEMDAVVRDIVTFLDYIAEPIKAQRQQLGLWVIGFLLVFLLIAYALKKEIWKDVH